MKVKTATDNKINSSRLNTWRNIRCSGDSRVLARMLLSLLCVLAVSQIGIDISWGRQGLDSPEAAIQVSDAMNSTTVADTSGNSSAGSSLVDSSLVDSSSAGSSSASSAVPNVVSSKSLLAVIQSGGPLMIPLTICSFVLLVFVFERVISLRKSRVIPGPLVTRILSQIRERQIDRDQAIELCEENPYPVCEVLEEGIRKWGRSSVEVEQAILDSGERVSNELKRNLRLINGIATVSPLLGLLGTVLGMIHAFDAISTISPGLDPKIVIATGISQALLTTAAGLTVAIPALIAHLYFTGCVDRRVMEIDAIGLQLVRLISAEGLAEQASPKTAKRPKKVA